MIVGYWQFPTVAYYWPEGQFNMEHPQLFTTSGYGGWTASPVFVVREFNPVRGRG